MCLDGLENAGSAFDGGIEKVLDRVIDLEAVGRGRVDDIVEFRPGLEDLGGWMSEQ